jgi:tRNA threonylcarbamoyladenosine biosynthesis protein TsaE
VNPKQLVPEHEELGPSGEPHLVIRLRTDRADQTVALGAALGALLVAGDVVLLAGELGAGKTTLTKGIAGALGVRDLVTSPTFTLVRSYNCTSASVVGEGIAASSRVERLVHADLFRLDHLREVFDLAIGELSEDAVAVVEWGDVAVPVFEYRSMTVGIAHGTPSSERAVSLELFGRFEPRRAALEEALQPWTVHARTQGQGYATCS